jgi:ABC-type molybdate transport system substrate-binding protein
MHIKKLLLTAALTSVFALSPLCFAKDAGHGHDYRTFHSNGKIEYGQIFDSYTSDLVVYLAGNQFMVIEKLIKDFQKRNPDIKTVYVETIPPGKILKEQILQQGMVYGQKTNQNPDIYGSVNLDHLKKLKEVDKMNNYITYTHNQLELMVAKGNPKHITGPMDLARDDLVKSLPNPLTEGIFKFYGSQMLKDLGIYEKVTDGKKCKGCWAVKDKTWFTERHHRETPFRIENSEADVGIVWTTEVQAAKTTHRPLEGVKIPAPYNMASKVSYVIGELTTAKNHVNAHRYLKFLETPEAQKIYASYGFVQADDKDLELKLVP